MRIVEKAVSTSRWRLMSEKHDLISSWSLGKQLSRRNGPSTDALSSTWPVRPVPAGSQLASAASAAASGFSRATAMSGLLPRLEEHLRRLW